MKLDNDTVQKTSIIMQTILPIVYNESLSHSIQHNIIYMKKMK